MKAMTDAEISKREWLDERAAILEFDAGYSRQQAERTAAVLWEKYQEAMNVD